MTKIGDIEENMETLDDVDELAEKIGSEDKENNIEDGMLNAELEHAEKKIDEGGDEEYYLLDDMEFEKMEFESWDEEDVVPPIENVHEYKRQMLELAFAEFLTDEQLDTLQEQLDWRDVHTSLRLEKEGFEEQAIGLRLRGYFRHESSSVKTYMESEAGVEIREAVDAHKAIVPEIVSDGKKVIEPDETIEQENVEHIEAEQE